MEVWNIKKVDYFSRLTEREKIEYILHYGMLAPSTHNTQPWKFKIEGSNCKVYIDPTLELREADPDEKNLFISIGCLIESIIIVADYFNVLDKVTYNYSPNDDCIAVVHFKNLDNKQEINKKLQELVSAITKRATFRGMFDNKLLTSIQKKSIQAAQVMDNVKTTLIDQSIEKDKIVKLTGEAVKLIASNYSFRSELSKWIISNYSSRKDGIPGYAYGFPDVLSLFAPWVVKIMNTANIMARKTYLTFNSASALIVISTIKDTKKDWIDAGRAAQRLMLTLTALEIKFSISVAAIQSSIHYSKLRKELFRNVYPQFIMGIGFSDKLTKLTPRHSLKDKLI